jgi:hypothetical protein
VSNWERRTYFCAWCKTQARGFEAPMGWHRFARRTNDPEATDSWKITAFYCGLRCAANDMERLAAREEALSA